jgi:hypothetical protein
METIETKVPVEKEAKQKDFKQAPEPNKEIEKLLQGYKENVTVNEEPEFEPINKKKGRGRPSKKDLESTSITDTQLLSGAMFLLLIDLIIPNLLVFLNNKSSKKKMKATALQLTNEQKRELAPLADEVAKQVAMKGNPLTIFIVSLLGIYGLNFMMLRQE